MPTFLEKCEEYFHSQDFYEIFDIERTAADKEIKKAYHRLSLLVHPDRVPESKKAEATEKFKVLGKIHCILQDEEKRKIYNETGDFDSEDSDALSNWMSYWRNLFKPISIQDFENYEKTYIGSDKEIHDVKRAYTGSKGDMDEMLDRIPFAKIEHEPRYIKIVRKLVDDGEVEEYALFFKEPAKKRQKRMKKWKAEAEEFESIKDELEELKNSYAERAQQRQSAFLDMISGIEAKYGEKKSKKGKRKSIKEGENDDSPPKRVTRAAKSKK